MSRNDNNEPSFAKRATAVLTGIVGAAAFHRAGGGRLIANGAPKAAKFLKSVSDDLSNMSLKDYDAENIGKLYKRHIADDNSTFKSILSDTNIKHKIDLDGHNLGAAVVKAYEISANKERLLTTKFHSEFADYAVDKLNSKYGKQFRDTSFKDDLDALLRHSLEKNDLIKARPSTDEAILNTELIDKYIDPDKIDLGASRNSFFKDLVDTVVDERADKLAEYKAQHSADGDFDMANNILKEFTGKNFAEAFGSAYDENPLINKINGERGLTVKDYLRKSDEFEKQFIQIGENETKAFDEMLREMVERDSSFEDTLLNAQSLRINESDEIIDSQELNSMKKKMQQKFAGTLPGKILKTTDFLNAEDPGIINYVAKGKANAALAKPGEKLTDTSHIQILGKMYSINENNELTHLKEFDDYRASSRMHGSLPRLYGKMMGLEAEREATNKVTRFFDINTSHEANMIDDIVRSDTGLGKAARKYYGGEKYNIIDRVFDEDLAINNPMEYRDNLKDLNSVFSGVTYLPGDSIAKKLRTVVKDDTSKELLDALISGDKENMLKAVNSEKKNIGNSDLVQMVKRGITNRQSTDKVLTINSTKLTGEKKTLDGAELIKREIYKEVLQRQSVIKPGVSNNSEIMRIIESTGAKDRDKENLKKLAIWGFIQKEGAVHSSEMGQKELKTIIHKNQQLLDKLTLSSDKNTYAKNSRFANELDRTISNIKEDYKELTTRTVDRKRPGKEVRAADQPDAVFIKRAYTPGQFAKDMLRDMNDATKLKANAKRFGMQFIAGRNTPEYVTDYTMIPYFFTERLIDPMNKIGLGFSNKNMGSTVDMWKAIMTKRVAPVAAGITAFSYLNYEAKNLTGTSITGAMAQGVANVDLGLRKIADVTGIGGILEAERRINPLTQYWLGEDYQDSNERKDYYENGYDAVRKGRWWAFGSASEFRGGKISFWQPNFVKRANSDWKDIGLYGSTEEKWKHSWLPTLRHPFAPIRRALDPYWLERKHYYDRPYMETAPLFSTGTPWGAILNPTIGEMIKPVRKMHRNETRRGLVDPKTLIAERNERLRAKAVDRSKENLFRISPNGVSNVTYTAKALADPGNAMITVRAGNGSIQSVDPNGAGYPETVAMAKDVAIGEGDFGVSAPAYGFVDDLETTGIGSFISNGVRGLFSATDYVAGANEQIKQKGAARQGSMVEKNNLATMPARVASQRIATRQDESDLLLTTSRHDFVNDALFAGKQLSGIWGFMGGIMTGDPGRRTRLESADKMSSFKSSFWDANVGGIGGGVMEIARRFFPHDDHSWTDINPIRNTMPDWLPERFQVGKWIADYKMCELTGNSLELNLLTMHSDVA